MPKLCLKYKGTSEMYCIRNGTLLKGVSSPKFQIVNSSGFGMQQLWFWDVTDVQL